MCHLHKGIQYGHIQHRTVTSGIIVTCTSSWMFGQSQITRGATGIASSDPLDASRPLQQLGSYACRSHSLHLEGFVDLCHLPGCTQNLCHVHYAIVVCLGSPHHCVGLNAICNSRQHPSSRFAKVSPAQRKSMSWLDLQARLNAVLPERCPP